MRNAFEYLEYSFFTLFSKRFGRIVGSSLLVDFVIILINGGILYFSLKIIGKSYIEDGSYDLMDTALKLLVILLGIMMIGLINIGWKSILIPLRSTESDIKAFHFEEDLTLFKKYFPYYLSYITWYSVLVLLWIILVVVGGFLFWYTEYYFLMTLYTIFVFILMIVVQTGLTLTWYNTLLNPAYGLSSFKESLQLTKRKKWTIFKKIFVFSFVLGLGSGIITSMHSLLPSPNIENTFTSDRITLSSEKVGIKIEKKDMEDMIPIINAFLPNLSIFYILFRIEGVLSLALVQIFLMRLTLDIRTLPLKKEEE